MANNTGPAMKRKFPVHIPFVEQLGMELWGFGDGKAELRLDLAESHLNSWEVAHGGVLMTLLDVAMAHAARSHHSHDPATAPGVATIEMKTTFMRPAEGELRALGSLMHRTTTLAFCEGRVVDGHGALCAHATATFKYLRALPSRGRQLKTLQEKT
jgi:uncharacterized protein (TIGR00369 family)